MSALFGAHLTTHEIPADARDEAEQLMRALQRDRPVFNQVWWAAGFEPATARV